MQNGGPSTFTIPEEFHDQLRLCPSKDSRTDKEIIETLTHHQVVPQGHEKNVWAFWHSGVANMPGWCQRNVCNWVRLCGPEGWTVRVLDSQPSSENNALKFISEEMLPEAFVKGNMTGEYIGPHSSDFLRGALLYLYGGVYMDVGIILIRHLDRICWKQLEDPASPYQVCVPWLYGAFTANHFTASRKGNPFIKIWHDLFIHLWRGRQNHKGLANDPLLAPLSDQMSFDEGEARFPFQWKVDAMTLMEYLGQVLAWVRICRVEGKEGAPADGDGFNGVEYWCKHVLIFDVLEENWGAEATIGFKDAGQNMLDLFSHPLDADRDSEEYKDAYKLTWRLLAKSSMQKITHGKDLTHDLHLGVLWDAPENVDKDHASGTFAELLRYGCVNFEQQRESIEYREPPRPKNTLKKGVMEE